MCHLAENMGDILSLLKSKMDQFKAFVTGVIEELEKNIE
jgi:hypothetical protein